MIEEINKYIKENEIRKLQLGCGAFPIDGWLNTDLSIKLCKRGIEYLDAGKPFPIVSDSFDYVYSEHLIEHLTYTEAKSMVEESYRILKKGGILRLSTPDLKFLIDLYFNPGNELNRSYIETESNHYNIPSLPAFIISHFHTDWGHKIIYDEESLVYLLKDAGFTNITRCEVGKSSHQHLNDIEQHGKHFKRQEYNKLQSMVFEAMK